MVLGVVSPYRPLSAFLLVVGASGLYTPGLVRLGGIHRLPVLFLRWGFRRAAPAQVTACRVVTDACREIISILLDNFILKLKGLCNIVLSQWVSACFLRTARGRLRT